MYTDETPLPEPRRAAAPSRPYEGPDDAPPEESDEDDSAAQPMADVIERPPPEKGSARAIKIDVEHLLSTQLGQPMPGPSTKASAIAVMTEGRGASFSKYSGSLEWRNAVVLWVNVGGSDYKNMFFTDRAPAAEAAVDAPGADAKASKGKEKGNVSQSGALSGGKPAAGGMTMTWYASPRNHEGTPVVARLIASSGGGVAVGGDEGADDEGSSSAAASSAKKKVDPILLFCRLPGEPYVCCGRLQYVSHVPRRQPIKFNWRLLDIHELRGKPAFDALMEEAE